MRIRIGNRLRNEARRRDREIAGKRGGGGDPKQLDARRHADDLHSDVALVMEKFPVGQNTPDPRGYGPDSLDVQHL